MSFPSGRQVEVVVINWRRPANVAAIVQALREQTAECTVTICDCHEAPEFELPPEALGAADRVYRWDHNFGSFNRFVPLGAYDHPYTFFFDDDMLPGRRCVEHFLRCAADLQAFGALGQIGRIVDADGTYRAANIARGPGFTEVDILVRALFVRTTSLVHALQARGMLQADHEPEDDIILAVALATSDGLGCYLTPDDPDPSTLVNVRELPSPYALSDRPTHEPSRSQVTRKAVSLGWRPLRIRRQLAEAAATLSGNGGPSRGVLYLALGPGYRQLAIASLSALRRYGYRGPVRVVTDDPAWVPSRLGCEVVVVPDVGDGFPTRHYKTRLLDFAYDLTLYLDSDAVPVVDIDEVWGVIGDADIALAADPRQTVGALIAKDWHLPEWRPEFSLMIRLGLTSRPYFNTGVMLFRRSASTAALFSSWHEEWLRFGRRDQLALVRAVALTDTTVQPLPAAWNSPAQAASSIDGAREAGVKVLHFLSTNRVLMTTRLAAAIADVERCPAGGDWERRGWLLPATNGSSPGGGFLARAAANGSAEHFELVLPAPEGGFECYRRPCTDADDSWHGPHIVGRALGSVESASLVAGTRGVRPTVELVVRCGAKLAHYWRSASAHSPWQGPAWIAAGVAGNPSLIQASGGVLELVVPLAAGGIAHYRRDHASAHPHWRGPAVFALELGRVDAVVLTETAQGSDVELEVLVRKDGRLAHYRQPAWDRRAWTGPTFFFDEASGIPGFVQGEDGVQVLAPLAGGGLVHLFRGAGADWQIATCIDRGGERVDAVSLVAPRRLSPWDADLEAVAVSGADVTWHRRANGPFGNWTSVVL